MGTTSPTVHRAVPESPWKTRLRMRIQTWQRHHGFWEPPRESDAGVENVATRAAGE